MKKITYLLFLTVCSFIWQINSQVQVGTGTLESENAPIEPFFGFSYSQTIYLSTEINASGTITGIQYFFSGVSTLANSQDIVIYMAESSRTSFSSTSDWEPIGSFTQVYSGGISVSGPGWVSITLDTPFAYSGTNNLIVAVEDNTPGFDSSFDDFYNTGVSTVRSISYFSDSVNPDPTSPPAASNRDDTIANIIFDGISQVCPNPSNMVASNITTNSADLDWTAGNTETQWNVEWKAGADFTPGNSEEDGTSSPTPNPSLSLSSLSSSTTYYVYYQADCGGDTSDWVGPYTFRTYGDCASTGTYIYTANSDASGSLGFVADTPGDYITLTFTAGSTESCCDFWYIVDSADGSGNVIATGSGSIVGAYESTTGEIAFYVDSDGSLQGSPFEYSLSCSAPPTCLAVTGVTIDSFSDSEVTVNWTPSGTGETDWEIIVQTTATADPGPGDSGTAVNATTDSAPPYTLGSLTEQTDYEVFVRANCGGGDFGDWVAGGTFTTPCTAIVPEYNADMSNHLPDSCWEEAGSGEVADGPGGIGFSDWTGTGSYSYGQSNYIALFSNSDREWLISPEFDLSADDYQLEVNVAVTSSSSGGSDDTMGSDDEVRLLITDDGGASWTTLETWNAGNEPDFSGTALNEDLTAYTGTVQFAIWASDGTVDDSEFYYFHIGQFKVSAIPSNVTVDYCNLQFPGTGSINEGDTFNVVARIFQDGRTQPAGSDPGIESWIGYSTTDATTTADFETPNWTWLPAAFNTQVGNDDEYIADLGSSLSGGTYFYVSRFRVDGGVFAYGGNDISDGDGGNFWDGTANVSGQLTVLPAPPTTVATLTINGCDASDSYNGAYASATDDVVWVELIYDGNCSEITVDTENTTGIDTEIGLYDAFGDVITTNDDGGTGSLSLITRDLAAGTYYIAAGAYNVAFSANFTASTTDPADVGTLFVNASTPNQPDFVNLQFPGSATITAGNSETVFAQIFEDGVTQGAGAGANITAEIGVSAVDATTTADFTSLDWTWTAAPYFQESGNNDEYSLAIGASLAAGTYYYVSRFSVDGGPFVYGGFSGINPGPSGGNFWDGTTNLSGVLTVNPKPEPTNHVTNFTAGPDSDTQITLAWTDNDGTQPADGFLIVGKTGAASFYTPVDGTDDANDTDWSDDEFEVKVASGVEIYVVTGLTADTSYDFEIYPYTNSGSTIDYKTDPVIPNASATTDSDPCVGILPDYTEDFTTYLDPCWQEAADGDLVAGPASFGSSNWLAEEFAHTSATGLGAANVNMYVSGDIEWLVTPSFNLSGGGYELLVDVALTDFNSTSQEDGFDADDEVRLVYSSDGTNWMTLDTWNQANTPSASGQTETYDLSTITGTNVQFAFYAIENTGTTAIDIDFHVDNFIIRTPPACTPTVVDSSTIVEDCLINSEFSVNVDVTSVGDGTVISDGTDTFPIIAGIVTAGPYPIGSQVTLTVEHSDPACNFSLGTFEFDSCPDIVDCSGSGLNTSFCYDDNDFLTFSYAVSDGASELSIVFNAGTIEDGFDFIYIYDGTDNTGVELFNSDLEGGGDLTGLAFTASSGNIFIEVVSDVTVSCADFSETEIEYDLFCGPLPVTFRYDGTWSPSDPNGATAAGDIIIVESGDATISSDTTLDLVFVNPGASLTVDSGATLTVNNSTFGLTLESTSTSYSSLILDGTVTGLMNYERHVNVNGTGSTGNNDLISAPLTGQAFNTFASANSNIFSNAGNTAYLFGPFDKTTGTYLTYANTETATLDAGVGYRAASDNNDGFTFTGTANNGDIDLDIENSGPAFQQWNLIGNPYPSYLNVQAFLSFDVDNGVPVVRNIDLFDSGTAAIYGYDGDATNGWVTYNLANTTPSTLIAPGQGFFVSADLAQTGTYDIAFRPSMRATGSSDDFIPGRNTQLIFMKLGLSSSTEDYRTDFYFNQASSQGLDVGYDAGIWGGTAPAFAIYSELVQGNTGIPLAIQSLNTTDLSDVTIPLGVNANMGDQITFSITETTLPSTVDVYLDDTATSSSTLLNTGDYVLTPAADLSGSGRFYLRFAESALSIGDESLNALTIFVDEETRSIVVQGQLQAKTQAEVYDLQGRLVARQNLEVASVQHRINGSGLASGVYVINLDDGLTQRTQKVILR